MKPTPASDSFEQWLQIATRNLPAHITNVVRGELAAHYQDACEAHRLDGQPLEAAQHAALADLGSAITVNDGLSAAHLSRGRALAAMLTCMGYPLLLMVYPNLITWMGEMVSYLFQDFLNTIILVFVMVSFVRIIGFNSHQLYRPVGLVIASLVLGTVVRITFFSIFDRLPLVGPGETVVWETGSALGILLNGGFIAAEMLSAGACAWLGWRLVHIEESLYGMLRPISILLMLVCPIGLGVAVSLLLGSMMGASYFSILGYMLVTLLMALLILTFFRAAFRRPSEPFEAA